jgi:hypothetical protein
MRFDDVEIKVTLGKDQTAAAVQALDLPSGIEPWRIYFCEDVTPGLDLQTPLLDRDVVLRARDKPGGKDDSTIKLRPSRRSQLTDHWLDASDGKSDSGEKWEFKVEADWSGDRRVLSASHTSDRHQGLVAEVAGGRRPVEHLFTPEQLDFLRDCSAAAINLATLTVLPPVTATRWRSVATAPPELGVRAERWTVDDLDFLELSVVADPAEARSRQDALTEFVRSRGLAVDAQSQNKTRQAIEHLVGQALTADASVTRPEVRGG